MTPDVRWIPRRVLIFVGGAAGTLLRFAVSSVDAGEIPWGTLAVNVAGSIGLGFLVGRTLSRPSTNRHMPLIGVGLFGALTTFGGVMVEVLDLTEAGSLGTAAGYLSLSVGLGLGTALITLRIGAQE